MILFTTLVLDVYIALLSFQVNGIVSTDAIRLPLLLFMIAESIAFGAFKMSKRKRPQIHIPSILMCAFLFLLYLVLYLFVVNLTFSRFLELAFFPICLIITYVNFIEIKDEKTFDQILDFQFYYLIVVAIAFLVAQVQKRGEYNNNVNTVYYVIFALPFILQQKRKYKKWIGMGIILVCLFFSLKRAPLLAVGFTMIFYNKTRGMVFKIIKRGIVVLLAIVVIDYLFATFMDVHMLDRLMTLADDGGSGRMDLAQQTLELLEQSSLGQLLFGHSLNTTASAFRLGAHNDFLEVLYRMGIVGFVIFMGYFVGILNKIKWFSRAKDYANANALRATIIMFAIVAFSSQLIFLPTYVGLVAMSISFSLARHRFIQAKT